MQRLFILILLIPGGATLIAAPFQNLDFDAANTNNIADLGVLYGTPEELVPGWQVYAGSILYIGQSVGFNVRPLGAGSVSLFDAFNSLEFPEPQRIPIEGLFAFGLNPGGPFPPGNPISLVQVGDIPSDALSIRFSGFGEPLGLFVNEIAVPLIYEYESSLPGTGSDAVRSKVMGDISPYTGDTVELRFRATWTFGGAQFHGIDSIYFSPMPVPEPSAWVVFALGVAVLGWRWRSRDKK